MSHWDPAKSFAVGVGTVAAALAAFKVYNRAQTPRVLPSNFNAWTPGEVRVFLQRSGVSDQACAVLLKEGIDGAVLGILGEDELLEMNVSKLGDRLKVVSAIRQLKASERPPARASKARVATPPPPPSPPPQEEAEEDDVDPEEIAARLGAIFQTLRSERFAQSSLEQQCAAIDGAAKELIELQTICSDLQPAYQRQLVPMIERAMKMVDDVRAAAQRASKGAPKGPLNALVGRLKESHEALKKLPSLPPSEAVPRLQEIARDVNAVTKEAQSLPEQQRLQILPLARSILEIVVAMSEELNKVSHKAAKPTQSPSAQQQRPSPQQQQKQPGQSGNSRDFDVLIAKLREMFEFFKGDALDGLSADQLRAALSQRQQEIAMIMNHIPKLPASEQNAIMPLASSVQDIVKKYVEIANVSQKVEQKQGSQDRNTPTKRLPKQRKTPTQSPTKRAHMSDVAQDVISRSIEIRTLLHSRKFSETAPDYQIALLRSMHAELADAAELLQKCDVAEQEIVLPKVRELMQEVAQVMKQSVAKDGAKPAKPAQSAPDFESIVERVSLILEKVKSPNFYHLTKPELVTACKAYLQTLVDCKQQIAALSDAVKKQEADSVLPIIAELESTLTSILAAVAKSQSSEGAQTTEATEESDGESPGLEEEPRDATAPFIVQKLQAMYEFLNSDNFLQATPGVQVDMAVQLQKEAENLVQRCEQLPEEERESLLPLAKGVNDMILKFMDINTPVTPGVSTFSGGHQHQEAEPATNDPREEERRAVAKEMQALYDLLASDKFRNANPDEQVDMAVGVQKAVEDLTERCEKLSEEARTFFLPRIKNLNDMILKFMGLNTPVTPGVSTFSGQAKHAAERTGRKSPVEESKDDEPTDAKEIVESIQATFDFLSSQRFIEAPSEVQMDMAKQLEKDVETLAAKTATLPQEERASLAPLVKNLHSMILKFVGDRNQSPVEELEDEEPQQAAEVVESLQAMFEFLNSEKFLEAPPEVQVDMAVQLQKEAEHLTALSMKLPDSEKETLMPLVKSLNDMILQFMDINTPVTPGVSTFSGAHKKLTRGEFFDALKKHIVDLRKTTITHPSDLAPYMKLLDEGSSFANRTDDESDLVREFQELLKNHLTALDKASPSLEGAPPSIRLKVTLVNLMKAMDGTGAHDKRFAIMEALQKALKEAEAEGFNWRQDNETPKLVQLVLARLQNLNNGDEGESDLSRHVNNATASLQGIEDAELSDLSPYIDLLQDVSKDQDNLSVAELKALQGLQDSIISAGEKAQTSPSKSSRRSTPSNPVSPDLASRTPTSPTSPMYTGGGHRAPPNTPSTTMMMGGTSGEGDEDALMLDESGDDLTSEESQVLTLLQLISDKLDESDFESPKELEDFERMVLDIQSQSPRGCIADEVERVAAKVQEQKARMAEGSTPPEPNGKTTPPPPRSETPPKQSPPQSPQKASETPPKQSPAQSPRTATPQQSPGQSPRKADATPQQSPGQSPRKQAAEETEAPEELADPSSPASPQTVLRTMQQRKPAKSPVSPRAALEQKRKSLVQLHGVLTHKSFPLLRVEQQDNAIQTASKLVYELTPEESECLNEETKAVVAALEAVAPKGEEIVEGATWNEVSMVPKIMDRLTSESFVSSTSLFDVQCIAKIISDLTDATTVSATKELKESVDIAKKLFSKRMCEFDGAKSGADDDLPPLGLTCLQTKDEADRTVERYLLYSMEEEEAASFSENHIFEDRVAAPPRVVEPPSAAELAEWNVRSEALVFSVSAYDDKNEDTTALTECALLVDALSTRHHFNVTAQCTDTTAESVKAALASAASTEPKRLFVYFKTPPPPMAAPPSNTFVMANGEAVTFAEVIEICRDVENVLIVLDAGQSLEVMTSHKGCQSGSLGVSLTNGAFLVSGSSKWLFDSLLTPIVLELLTKAAGPVSPEDIVNAVVRMLARPAMSTGAYSDVKELGKTFFLAKE